MSVNLANLTDKIENTFKDITGAHNEIVLTKCIVKD